MKYFENHILFLLLGVTFYLSFNILTVSFLMLASKWPKLMLKWEIMESELSEVCNEKQKLECIKKIRFITAITLIAALRNFD